MMTRKDFELIARTIHGGNNYPNETARRMVAFDFADVLATQNPNFDRSRFLRACGVATPYE